MVPAGLMCSGAGMLAPAQQCARVAGRRRVGVARSRRYPAAAWGVPAPVLMAARMELAVRAVVSSDEALATSSASSSSPTSSSSFQAATANVRLPQDVKTLEKAFAAAVADPHGAQMESPYESLEDLPHHMLLTGLAAAAVLANAVEGCASCTDLASGVVAAAVGFLAADLGSGVYHWSVDNYGSASTPVLGHQIAAFQGHHAAPFTIVRRGAFNNAAPGAVAMLPFLLAGLALPGCTGALQMGWSMFVGSIFAAQPLHRWAHMPPSKVPPAVRALQDAGLVIPVSEHMCHHNGTFEGRYCIVAGLWNPLLDGSGFFRAAERVVEKRTGVLPKWRRDAEAAEAAER